MRTAQRYCLKTLLKLKIFLDEEFPDNKNSLPGLLAAKSNLFSSTVFWQRSQDEERNKNNRHKNFSLLKFLHLVDGRKEKSSPILSRKYFIR